MWGDRNVTAVDGKETTEKAFATDLKVQYTPTMLFLDETGAVVLRVNGYYAPEKFELALDFVSGKHDKEGSFKDYYSQAQSRRQSGQRQTKPTPYPAHCLPRYACKMPAKTANAP